jgi:hypothetical protein
MILHGKAPGSRRVHTGPENLETVIPASKPAGDPRFPAEADTTILFAGKPDS